MDLLLMARHNESSRDTAVAMHALKDWLDRCGEAFAHLVGL